VRRASGYAPEAGNRWEAMLLGYQRMAPADLFVWQPVVLTTPVAAIISRAGHRAICDHCGEEILNEREVLIRVNLRSAATARTAATTICVRAADYVMPLTQWGVAAALTGSAAWNCSLPATALPFILGRCLNRRHAGAQCTRCVDGCPVQAIALFGVTPQPERRCLCALWRLPNHLPD
jgi:ferredoxin